MKLRNIKEAILQKPAEGLARLNVDPNVITLVGLVLALFAEGIALKKGIDSTSLNESFENETKTGIFWLATLARVLSLVADGLDGSVARARKKIDPSYANENGSYIDGATDRLVNTIRMMVESYRFASADKHSAATLAAITGVASNVPSYLRAKTEAKGGTTTEQSLSLLKFAGTHAGRTAIYMLISLEFSQVDQIVSALTFGKHITPSAWEAMRQILIGYVATSTVVVSAERAGDLADVFSRSEPADFDSIDSVDSAGLSKTTQAHEKRATLYLAALIASGLWAGLSITTMNHKQR